MFRPHRRERTAKCKRFATPRRFDIFKTAFFVFSGAFHITRAHAAKTHICILEVGFQQQNFAEGRPSPSFSACFGRGP